MQRSCHCNELIHIDLDNEGEILENSSDLTSSFQEFKYFIIITDNVIYHCWIFFIKEKSEIYEVLNYFLNHLINQEMHSSAFVQSD